MSKGAQMQLRTFGERSSSHLSFQRSLKKSTTHNVIFFSRCYVSRETSVPARPKVRNHIAHLWSVGLALRTLEERIQT
jgi:hypothetical protein